MTAAPTNLARSRWRTLQAEERALEGVAADRLSDPTPALDPASRFGGAVADAIRELPRRQAQTVLLHYYGDLTLRETAARMGLSEGTVKAALHEARGCLGRSMDDLQIPDRRRRTMIGWQMAGSQPGQYDHELDVPGHARAIALGVLLVGRGEVFMAYLGLEAVGEDVPTTKLYETPFEGPWNLDFSETGG